VVAGAVVGSVGGMAVLLLLLVLVARWWKHHSRSVRYESGGDSATDLTPQPGPYRPNRHSFLPVGAAAFMNRLSGGHHRSSSPTLPNVAEQASGQERGFQKIAGRKMPSQFSTGMEEGPVTRDFEKRPIDRRLVGVAQSPSSSYYRDSNDTTNFFAAHAGSSQVAPQPLFAATSSDEPSPEAGPPVDHEKEIIRPSPARTPNITNASGTYFRDLTGSESNSSQARPRLDRNYPSDDGSRSAKFAEHVR
jgi:hypothetical protein